MDRGIYETFVSGMNDHEKVLKHLEVYYLIQVAQDSDAYHNSLILAVWRLPHDTMTTKGKSLGLRILSVINLN